MEDQNIIHNIKQKSTYKMKFAFALGLTSTMPIAGIPIGTTDISFYRILFFIAIAYCGINAIQNNIKIGMASRKLVLWLIEGAFSCFCGWLFLISSAPEWSSVALSYIPRVLSLLLFAFVWGSQQELSKVNDYVAKGFLWGAIFNCFWVVVDACGFYLSGVSINNVVFSGYIARNAIRYDSFSLIYSSSLIRSSGFNYDPSHIGFLAPIVACYAVIKKKYWLLLLAIAAVFGSASTTALVTSIIVIVLNYKNNSRKKKLSLKRLLALIVTMIALGIVLGIYWDKISTVVSTAYSSVMGRISRTYLHSTDGNPRIDYIRFLPRAMINMLPFMLFGSGFGTSSLGYVSDFQILNTIGNGNYFPYDPENTYISYFLDTGIVGLIIFLGFFAYLYRQYKGIVYKKNHDEFSVIVWSMICSSTFSMLFYHYILYGMQMLIFTVALSELDLRSKECKMQGT